MIKNKHNADLIKVGDRLINRSSLRFWTEIAKECYERNCTCDGCKIVPKESFHFECRIKDYVRGYFLLGVKYPGKEKEEKKE